ncbi:hypothetical protein LINPERHAP2_LOCUS26579 [Linum perenne]
MSQTLTSSLDSQTPMTIKGLPLAGRGRYTIITSRSQGGPRILTRMSHLRRSSRGFGSRVYLSNILIA